MTPLPSLFPVDLLRASIEAKVDYFSQKIITHPEMEKRGKEIMRHIHFPAGRSLIIVPGTPGVGKTTLEKNIKKRILLEYAKKMELDPGLFPVISYKAPAPERGNFSWFEFIRYGLAELTDPFLLNKMNYGDNPDRTPIRFKPLQKVDLPLLKYNFETHLKLRGTKIILTDEGQHLAIMTSGRRLSDQMEAIKSFAEINNLMHVLFGSYELLSLLDINGQVVRRTFFVPFNNYQDTESDKTAFGSVLQTFQQYFPLENQPDLISNMEYFHKNSLGSVGLLKDWITDALSLAFEEYKGCLTILSLEMRNTAPKGV